MRNCPNCNAPVDDGAVFCNNCGIRLIPAYANPVTQEDPNQPQNPNPNFNQNPNPNFNQNPYAAYGAPAYNQPVHDPFDHTAEFEAKDVSDNKVIAMLVYLLGIVGIFLAIFVAPSSPYVSFHVRQSLKFVVCEVLLTIVTTLLCWTFLVPLAAIGLFIAFTVIKVICFVQICKGEAKEPAIVRNLNFLK